MIRDPVPKLVRHLAFRHSSVMSSPLFTEGLAFLNWLFSRLDFKDKLKQAIYSLHLMCSHLLVLCEFSKRKARSSFVRLCFVGFINSTHHGTLSMMRNLSYRRTVVSDRWPSIVNTSWLQTVIC